MIAPTDAILDPFFSFNISGCIHSAGSVLLHQRLRVGWPSCHSCDTHQQNRKQAAFRGSYEGRMVSCSSWVRVYSLGCKHSQNPQILVNCWEMFANGHFQYAQTPAIATGRAGAVAVCSAARLLDDSAGCIVTEKLPHC
jgi:hypothetical protein